MAGALSPAAHSLRTGSRSYLRGAPIIRTASPALRRRSRRPARAGLCKRPRSLFSYTLQPLEHVLEGALRRIVPGYRLVVALEAEALGSVAKGDTEAGRVQLQDFNETEWLRPPDGLALLVPTPDMQGGLRPLAECGHAQVSSRSSTCSKVRPVASFQSTASLASLKPMCLATLAIVLRATPSGSCPASSRAATNASARHSLPSPHARAPCRQPRSSRIDLAFWWIVSCSRRSSTSSRVRPGVSFHAMASHASLKP